MTDHHFTISDFETVGSTPLILNVDLNGRSSKDWIKQHKDSIEHWLSTQGAIVIRGLKIHSSRLFAKLLTELFSADLLQYQFRSTPRTALSGNIYTATEYKADQTIPQHNEKAYSKSWPLRLGFCCMVPAEQSGATPIADSRLIYQSIPAEIREEFERKQVMYVRHYGDLDLPWSEVFQTEDKAEVEGYCAANDIQFEWLSNNGLKTKEVCQATLQIPNTLQKVWFNQAHLFHVSNLDAESRQSLLSIFGKDKLPRNAFFGDGSDIPEAMLEEIRNVYASLTLRFPWQKHDLMLLNNTLFSHGREPYTGSRQVLVGMARPNSTQQ